MGTVGVFTDGHGRGTPAACFGWTWTVESVSTGASASAFRRVGPQPPCADAGWKRRARCHSPYPAVSAPPRAVRGHVAPSPGQPEPVCRPSASARVRPRSRWLQPARVPAGQRV